MTGERRSAGPDGSCAAPGACPPRTTSPTTTTSGAAPSTATTRSSNGSAWRRSSPGLSWITILRRREGFRTAFAGFKIASVAAFTDADEERLLADAGHHPQPRQDRGDARQRAGARRLAAGELDALIWSYAPDPADPPGPAHARRRPGGHPRVHGAGQGPQEARHPLRRPDDGVRADAGVRPGRRPPGGLRRARALRPGSRLRRPPCRRRPGTWARSSEGRRSVRPVSARYFGFSLATNAWTAIAWSSDAPARAWSSSSLLQRLAERVAGAVRQGLLDRRVRHRRALGQGAGHRAASAARSAAGHQLVGDAQLVRLLRGDRAREEQQVGGAALADQPGQRPRDPGVGGQRDAREGGVERGGVGDDPVVRGEREAEARARRHPVDPGHHRLRHLGEGPHDGVVVLPHGVHGAAGARSRGPPRASSMCSLRSWPDAEGAPGCGEQYGPYGGVGGGRLRPRPGGRPWPRCSSRSWPRAG